MWPQRRHPLSITSHGRAPKDGFVVMQPHRKCLLEINCWPEGSPMLCLFENCTKLTAECENLTKEMLHWADAAPYGLVWHHTSHRLIPTWFGATCLVQLHTTTLESHHLALNPNCVTLGTSGTYNLLGSSVSLTLRCVQQWLCGLNSNNAYQALSRVPDTKSVHVQNSWLLF